MAELRDEISVGMARRLAGELGGAWEDFPSRRFLRGLGEALEPLALMGRVELIAERLRDVLPQDFDVAADVLWRALDSTTFDGWMVLPCGTYVGIAGIDRPEVALPLLAGLTPRWSSEYPIRLFVERHRELTYEHLRRWTADHDEHLRRLVSEGTRPRLPWARQLRDLIADPRPNVELLDQLVDDPSLYVRRSVANHLNDIAKDHPDLAVDLAKGWLARGDDAAWAVRHGLRTLIKQGDPRALALVGVDPDADVRLAGLSLDRHTVTIGEAVTLTVTVELHGGGPVEAMIDYRVHYVGANGRRSPKVFKLARRQLVPGEATTVTRRHRFEHVSIRRLHPGPHTIDVQVNGRVLASVDLDVLA